MTKTCIIIAGPTAVGKTALAIELAKHFSTSIISADSRQCFKELNIGVAKPSDKELDAVPHYFINSHSVKDVVNAVVFEKYALEKIQDVFMASDIAVMVGGTGLYINAFCDGLDEIPSISPGVKESIIATYKMQGISWLQEELKQKDPVYFKTGEVKNPQRLMRALEIKLSTGHSILEYQTKEKAVRDFKIIKIGLEIPRPAVYDRINERVEAMITDGLLNEVTGLKSFRGLNALQTVGYKELFEYLDGKSSLDQAITAIKTNTRHYAKRQMTWFKKDLCIDWCEPDFNEAMAVINKKLKAG